MLVARWRKREDLFIPVDGRMNGPRCLWIQRHPLTSGRYYKRSVIVIYNSRVELTGKLTPVANIVSFLFSKTNTQLGFEPGKVPIDKSAFEAGMIYTGYLMLVIFLFRWSRIVGCRLPLVPEIVCLRWLSSQSGKQLMMSIEIVATSFKERENVLNAGLGNSWEFSKPSYGASLSDRWLIAYCGISYFDRNL